MSHPRVRLSIGASKPVKTLAVAAGLVMIGIGVFVALVAYGLSYGARTVVTSSIPDGEYHIDEKGKLVPGPGDSGPVSTTEMVVGIVGAICALFFVVAAIYLMLRILRAGAWLEGSVLHVRGALRTKKQDLAKAEIGGGTRIQSGRDRAPGQRVQVLTATDPASGRTLTLPLHGRGMSMLPSDQLRMLANAITNQRSRKGKDDQAFVVAERLRGFADDPFS
jgi:hypothetical protein